MAQIRQCVFTGCSELGFLFLMIWFLKKCDKRVDFDFEIVNFPFLDGDVHRSTPYESISLNSFVLLEHLAILLTSTLAINCELRNFLNKDIGIINFAKPLHIL